VALLDRRQVVALEADDRGQVALSRMHHERRAGQRPVGDATETVDAEHPVLVDRANHEPELVQVRGDEDARALGAAELDRDLPEPIHHRLEPARAQVRLDRRGQAVLVAGRRRDRRESAAGAEDVGGGIAERRLRLAHGFVRHGSSLA
jgi:hypothetical protein